MHLLTGDMLDTMMDPLHLQHFTKLCVLCISTSLYWRMSRWVAGGIGCLAQSGSKGDQGAAVVCDSRAPCQLRN